MRGLNSNLKSTNHFAAMVFRDIISFKDFQKPYEFDCGTTYSTVIFIDLDFPPLFQNSAKGLQREDLKP